MRTLRHLALAALAIFAHGYGCSSAQAATPAGCFDTTGPLTLYRIRPNAVGPQLLNCVNQTFEILSNGSVSTTTASSFSAPIAFLDVYIASIGARSGAGFNPYVAFTSAARFNDDVDFRGNIKVVGIDGLTQVCPSSMTLLGIQVSEGIVTGGTCGAAGGGSGGGGLQGWVIQDFTNDVDGSTDTFTLSTAPAIGSFLLVVLDNHLLTPDTHYIFTPPFTLRLSSPPAADTSTFYVAFTTAGATNVGLFLQTNTTNTFTAAQTFAGNAIFNGQLIAYGPSTHFSSETYKAAVLIQSTFTVQGPAALGYGSVPAVSVSSSNVFQIAKGSGTAGYFAMSDAQGGVRWAAPGELPTDPLLIGKHIHNSPGTTGNAVTTFLRSFSQTNAGSQNTFHQIDFSPTIIHTSSKTHLIPGDGAESTTYLPAFTAATLKNLVVLGKTQGFAIGGCGVANNNVTISFVVRKNGADTSLQCSMTMCSGGTYIGPSSGCRDSVNTASLSAGDNISLVTRLTVSHSGATITTEEVVGGIVLFQMAF